MVGMRDDYQTLFYYDISTMPIVSPANWLLRKKGDRTRQEEFSSVRDRDMGVTGREAIWCFCPHPKRKTYVDVIPKIRLFTNYDSQCHWQPKDKQGQAWTRKGQSRDKAGTNRDKQGHSPSVPACPYLSLSVHASPCLSLSIPVCPCLSLSVPVCLCTSLHLLYLHVYPCRWI